MYQEHLASGTMQAIKLEAALTPQHCRRKRCRRARRHANRRSCSDGRKGVSGKRQCRKPASPPKGARLKAAFYKDTHKQAHELTQQANTETTPGYHCSLNHFDHMRLVRIAPSTRRTWPAPPAERRRGRRPREAGNISGASTNFSRGDVRSC